MLLYHVFGNRITSNLQNKNAYIYLFIEKKHTQIYTHIVHKYFISKMFTIFLLQYIFGAYCCNNGKYILVNNSTNFLSKHCFNEEFTYL